MMWKGLGLVTNTESPIVVVLRSINLASVASLLLLLTELWEWRPLLPTSGSMEPAFYRGDLLFLANPRNTPYVVGDITVYKIPGADIPIVHRVIETHQTYVLLNITFISDLISEP